MHYDAEERRLTFDDDDEVRAFHAQISVLLREATIAASSSTDDAELGAARAKDLLGRFGQVTAALNALRAHLTRTAG